MGRGCGRPFAPSLRRPSHPAVENLAGTLGRGRWGRRNKDAPQSQESSFERSPRWAVSRSTRLAETSGPGPEPAAGSRRTTPRLDQRELRRYRTVIVLLFQRFPTSRCSQHALFALPGAAWLGRLLAMLQVPLRNPWMPARSWPASLPRRRWKGVARHRPHVLVNGHPVLEVRMPILRD